MTSRPDDRRRAAGAAGVPSERERILRASVLGVMLGAFLRLVSPRRSA
jgi:hypothetical protein